ncbi:hypothetical protein GSI_11301 [Ganoderma sinense ZZ0214-1]|uniref:Reverse transcriptase/retrotransposon-derived protein RNase H-like domain-containing protein n=1 Tax=Ganoderma sinense ZZ0214-1 TaxID=1077348 RepID=A0A2G8RYP6_9APHY|nr:hypothetical protein GSI_11301 [Ganoderma sinense ZZ0214-1]
MEEAQIAAATAESLEHTGSSAADSTVPAVDVFLADVASGGALPIAGEDSHPIRILWCIINEADVAECILDGGSQIASISEECCSRLKLPIDPLVTMNVRSANGSLDGAIGLARDVPVRLTPKIVVFLQLFVIRNAAYDVLLGRPFEVLLKAHTENFSPNLQFLTSAHDGSNRGFSDLEDLLEDGDATAFVFEYDAHEDKASAVAYSKLPDLDSSSVTLAYLLSCDGFGLDTSTQEKLTQSHSVDVFLSSLESPAPEFSSPDRSSSSKTSKPTKQSPPSSPSRSSIAIPEPDRAALVDSFLATKKKYKPVALKTRPLLADLPEKFRIERKIIGDPLTDMPPLNPNPPSEFAPGSRYTAERRAELHARHAHFLWPAELDLMDDMIKNQENAFAWTDAERGSFRRDFFPPVEIPTVPHKPWVLRNIPIPPGLYDEICDQIRKKIASGVYEPSNSCYRSRWFAVAKKDGRVRLVHSLEPLNAVTIQHSGVPPIPEYIVEQFAARPCVGSFDLFVGYDEREIAESSRDFTTFQTPFGAHRLTTLPMGWTNSVPIFHDDVTYILRDEIPAKAAVYVDDVMTKGPDSDYRLPDGSYETIPENPGIRRFVWEHLLVANRIIRRIAHAGGTFSGPKAWPCIDERVLVGSRCTPIGRLPERERVDAIRNWRPCTTLSEVRAFLGTVGVARIFIRDFAKRANALTMLTRKDVLFEFGPAQLAAFDDLKTALLDCPALRPLRYDSDAPIILGVDTSFIAVGYLLCQQDEEDPKIRYYNRFGSITLNARKSRFSQPKLELYGLFRALSALKLRLLSIRNLIVETDAGYIKGMLANPDLQPSASMNRWIMGILTFHFELVHVPGKKHAPDGLSRRPPQPGDKPEPPPDEFEDWLENLYSFVHITQPHTATYLPLRLPPSPDTVDMFALGLVPQARPPDIEPPRIPTSRVPRTRAALMLSCRAFATSSTTRSDRLVSTNDNGSLSTNTQPFSCSIRPASCGDVRKAARIGWLSQRNDVLLSSSKCTIAPAIAVCSQLARSFASLVSFADEFCWLGSASPCSSDSSELDPSSTSDSLDGSELAFASTAAVSTTSAVSAIGPLSFAGSSIGSPPAWDSTAGAAAAISSVFGVERLFQELLNEVSLVLFEPTKDALEDRDSRANVADFAADRADLATTSLRDSLHAEVVRRDLENGVPWVAACTYLADKYHLHHIRVSGYNSQANGIVERPHFNVRDALFKATEGDGAHWHSSVHTVLWADRTSVRRRLGCSPFFAVTGSHPILPLDFKEATYLVGPPEGILTTEELIALRATALQKRADDVDRLRSAVYAQRLQEAEDFESRNRATTRDFDAQPGSLVLIRNTAIEKSLNRKMRARYLGPYLVVFA